MKKGSKILLILSVFALALFMVGCKKSENQYTRVTVDINPSIELIVDEENKVLSVTALNDDGNIIIVGEAIVGKSAEEAIELIINISTETGFIVKGNVEAKENEVQISVSGNKELFSELELKAKDALSKLNVNALVTKKEALQKEALEELVEMANPALSEDEIEKMSKQELLTVLKDIRIETQELYSQELHSLYQGMKDYQINISENEKVEEIMRTVEEYSVHQLTRYMAKIDTYKSLIKGIEEAKYKYLVSKDSEYQKAYAALMVAKDEMIVQKSIVANLEEGLEKTAAMIILEQKELVYSNALKVMESVYQIACKLIEEFNEAINDAYEDLAEFKKTFPIDLKLALRQHAEEIDRVCNEAKDKFFETFEETYKEEIEYYKQLAFQRKEELKQNIKDSQSTIK